MSCPKGRILLKYRWHHRNGSGQPPPFPCVDTHPGAKAFLRSSMPLETCRKGDDAMVTYGELFQLIDIVIQIVTLVIVLTKKK